MSEITRNQAIQIVEDIRTAISAGSVTNTMEAQVLEYCVSVLGRRIEETGQSGYIENLPDVVAFLAGFSSPTTLRVLLNAITEKIPAEASRDNKLADKAFVTALTNALQNAVDAINANIGNGYVYAGIATPSGTPVSGKVFYLARQAGQYANFEGLTVTEGVNILKRNGSTWTQEQLLSMADIRKNPLIGYYECDTAGDTAAKTVTAAGYVLPATGGSVKIKMANRNTVANATLNINSTGAKPLYYNGQRAGVGNTWDTNEIIEVFYDGAKYQAYNVAGCNGDGVFDISAYNLTDGQPTPYEDLAAALGPNGDNVPLSLRKGGMRIKFVQSSYNRYVQYRLIGQSFSTDTTKWQESVEKNTYNFIDGSDTYLNLFKNIIKEIYFFGADTTNGKQVRVSYIGTNHPNLGGNNYLGLQLAYFLPNDNTEKRVNFIALVNTAAQNELIELKPESGNYDNLGLYIKTTDTFSWNSDQILGSVDILLTSNAVGDNNEAAIQYSIKRATESEWLDVGNGYSYTSILRALKETNKNLLVHAGNYDIYTDYINYYGADFWTNYTDWDATDLFKAGLFLAPNRKIRFEANTYLIFDAQTNNNVKNRFSLFFLSYNNSIEYAHMMIEDNSIEYFIHDDYSNYINAKGTLIKGCIFNGTPYGNACIGGGCGTNNIHTIIDCIFLGNNGIHDISYHNTTAGGTANRCKIYVSKCYGSKKCVFRSYGEATSVTDCIVTGCTFGEITCYIDAGQPNDNMRLFKFNSTETGMATESNIRNIVSGYLA